MTLKSLRRALVLSTVVGALFGAADSRADASGNDETALFQKIKDKEALENLPPAAAIQDIGTYDCAGGPWKGLEDTAEPVTPKPNAKGVMPSDKPIMVPPKVTMFARKAYFRFKATHRSKPLEVVMRDYRVANDQGSAVMVPVDAPKKVSVDKDEVLIDMDPWGMDFNAKNFELSIDFTVSCGPATPKFGRISFTRVPAAGAGVYAIPALPVTIIYAPPLDSQKKNQMTYETSQYFGTSVVISHGTGGSDTKDASTPPLYAGSQFQQIASPLGKALSAIPVTAPIGKVFSVLSDGMGSVTDTHTSGFEDKGTRSLTVRSGTMERWATINGPSALGPGEDDQIVYLHNANIAWMGPPVSGPDVRIALLDYKVLMKPTVHELKADLAELSKPGTSPKAKGKNSLLDANSIRALLKLDPLADNPTARLPASRYYVKSPCSEVNGGGGDTALSVEQSYESDQSSVETRLETEQWNKGMLSFMSDGVDHNETMTTTVRNFRSTALHSKSTTYAHAKLNVNSAAGERYFVTTYFDRVFGSFVVQKCQP
jgi:hypothetical protein